MYGELMCKHTWIAKQLHVITKSFYQKSTDNVPHHKIKAEDTTEYAATLKDDYEVNNMKELAVVFKYAYR